MNELKVFQSSEFGELGVLTIDGKEYFPATQCAKVLGYTDPYKAIKQHCKEDGWVKRPVIDNLGRTQEMKFISEGNLYRLIVRSKLPAAEKFERWVFDEVLPELKRSGSYGNNINLEEVISKTVAATMLEVFKQISPAKNKRQSLANHSNLPKKKARKYTYTTPLKVETLEPELKKKVDEMIISGEYSCQQIANYIMNNSDICISQMSVNRYKNKYFICCEGGI